MKHTKLLLLTKPCAPHAILGKNEIDHGVIMA